MVGISLICVCRTLAGLVLAWLSPLLLLLSASCSARQRYSQDAVWLSLFLDLNSYSLW